MQERSDVEKVPLKAGPDRRQREPHHPELAKTLTRCAPLPRRCWWVGRSHDVEALRNTMTGARCGAWREKAWGEEQTRCRHGPEGGATGPKDCRAFGQERSDVPRRGEQPGGGCESKLRAGWRDSCKAGSEWAARTLHPTKEANHSLRATGQDFTQHSVIRSTRERPSGRTK